MNAYIFKSRIRLALVLFVAVGLSRVAFATPETRVGACEIARGYITLVNEGRYSEISALFSENALYLPPTGEIINGRDAIHDFYERFLSALRPSFRLGHVAEQGSDCAIELEAVDPDSADGYTLTAVDFFTVDASGLISRMAVYLRPAAMAALQKQKRGN